MMQMFTSPKLVSTFAEPFIVVLAPHMDDEVIGPGGTIALHRQAGATVTHVFLTDGLGSGPEWGWANSGGRTRASAARSGRDAEA